MELLIVCMCSPCSVLMTLLVVATATIMTHTLFPTSILFVCFVAGYLAHNMEVYT